MSKDLSRINITHQAKVIHFLAKNDLTLQLDFIKQNTEEYYSSYISLDTSSVEDIRNSCQNFVKEREKWGSFEYGEQPDNEKTTGVFRTINVNDIPFQRTILKKPTTLENSITEDLMNSTKWIGFRFESSNNKSVLCLKRISNSYFVLRKHNKFHFVRGGVATLFRDNLVKFPGDFDIIKYDDLLLIFSPFQFEELFHYHILHEKYRKQVFDYIRKKADYEIEDLDDFEDVVKNDRKLLRKFGPIKDKQIYNKKLSEIKKALKVRKVPTLTISGNTMKFKSSRSFINFFNDNHLSSQFTKKHYLSHSKTEER